MGRFTDKKTVMKKYIFLLTFLLGSMLLLQSCKKEHKDTKYVTLNETVQAGQTYSLDLATYGDADDVPSITTQADHYFVSEINKDASAAKNVYHFSADSKFTTPEKVVITLAENHGGRGDCKHDDTVITINFTMK